MIHIVMFKVKPDAAEADVARLVTEAREKLTQIPGVKNLTAGWATPPGDPYDVVLTMHLDDATALETYRTHPLHVAYVENVVKPVKAERFAIDAEDTPR